MHGETVKFHTKFTVYVLEEYFHYWVNASCGMNTILFVELDIKGANCEKIGVKAGAASCTI